MYKIDPAQFLAQSLNAEHEIIKQHTDFVVREMDNMAKKILREYMDKFGYELDERFSYAEFKHEDASGYVVFHQGKRIFSVQYSVIQDETTISAERFF